MATVPSVFEEMLKKINESPFYVRELVFFTPAGLLTGFVTKNFGKTLLVILASVIVSFWLGHYLGLVDFDTVQFKALLGINQLATWADVGDFARAWAHEHTMGCIIFLISLFIGWKLGA